MKLITRTISINILEHSKEILDTINEYVRILNMVSEFAFTNKIWSSITLHKELYHTIRSKSSLKSQMVCSAIRQGVSVYNCNVDKVREQYRSKIHKFTKKSILLQGGMGRDWRFLKTKELSISTIYGKIKCFYNISEYQKYYLDETWTFGAARLLCDGNIFRLNISCSKFVEEGDISKDVSGVDIGINYIAVVSNPENKSMFFKGGKSKNKNLHYYRVRKSLQTKGTRGARKLLKRLSGKQFRFQKDVNHCISKKIVQFAQESKCNLALENLKEISKGAKHSKKLRNIFHGWSFAQLRKFITYKAESRFIEVFIIEPKNTSKECSECGHIAEGQRTKHIFKCKFCGFELHADLNASRNIAHRARLGK